MKILVYGAGNIGRLYAARLAEAGQDVSILARGGRLADIRERGIQLVDAATGRRTTSRVHAVERLEADDAYDLVLVVLPKNRVSEILPVLGAHRATPAVMFFGNNAAGPAKLVESLGRDRVLLGFPGAAAVEHAGGIRYLILSAREQPTTIGELDGTRSERLAAVAGALEAAGFPVAVSSNMDAWLKTHAAEIVPTAGALYMAGADPHRLARSRDALVLMLRAIREGHRVLSAHRIPIEPKIHRAFAWIPEPLLLALMRRRIEDETTALKIGHALGARDEMKTLAEELRALAEEASVATPACNRLYELLGASPVLQPRASASV